MTPIGGLVINPKVQFKPITDLEQVFAVEPVEVSGEPYPATALSFVISRPAVFPALSLAGSISYPYTELPSSDRTVATKNTPLGNKENPWSVVDIADRILQFFLDRPVFKESDNEAPVFSLITTSAGDLGDSARPYTSDAVKEALVLGLSHPHTECRVDLGLSSITLHYQNSRAGVSETRVFIVGMESSDDASQ